MGAPGRLGHALWRCLAGSVVVLILGLAVLLAGLRLATPLIERYAEPLAGLVMPDGYRVALDELRLAWWGWGPDLEVTGLRLDRADGDPILVADRLRARFDVTASLLQRRLVWSTVRLRADALVLPEQRLLKEPVVPRPVDWLRIEHGTAHVGILAVAGRPLVANLTGAFRLTPDGAELRLDSAGVMLGWPVLNRTLSLERLAGTVRWRHRDAGWELLAADLQAVNTDLELVLQGGLRQLAGEPHFDLEADFRVPDVGRIPAYLPVDLNPGLIDWLEQSLQSGRVTGGRLILRGRVADFPFESAPGEFLVAMRAADMTLAYHPDWPALEQLQAGLRFHGRSLTIEAEDGRLDGHRLLSTVAVIDDLRNARLQLSGQLEGELSGMRRTVLDGPLHDRLSAYLTPLRLDGRGELQLDLRIPLTADGATTGVDGVLSMEGATGVLQEPELALDGMRGALRFTEQGLHQGQFALRIVGEPARLELSGDDTLALQAELAGHWSDADLRQTPLAPLADWLEGRSDWRIALSVPRAAPGRYRLNLTSDLVGTRVLLPGNLGKPTERPRAFRLQLDVEGEERRWRVDHGPVRELYLQQGADGRLQTVSGTLVDPLIGGHAPGSIRLQGRREASGLQVVLDGDRLQGQLAVPERIGPRQPLWLALDHLNLMPGPDGGDDPEGALIRLDPRELPPVMITVRELQWRGRELGQLTLQGEPRGLGYRLSDVQLHHARHRLQLQGIWRFAETVTDRRPTDRRPIETALQAQLASDSLGELLALFDLGGIEGAATRLSFGLRWPGSPADIRQAGLRGEFELQIDAGTLVAIEPGPERLLGLLNPGSLLRRLQLDFDDLTDSGLAFDRIIGRLTLQDGRLLTDDLQIVGPAARMMVSGLLDLQERRVDQVVTVKPEIGVPLALAGTLAGGPVVGAAVFFADQLLKHEFDHPISYRYALTGDWDALTIEPIRTETPP